MALEITEKDRDMFITDCRTWEDYTKALVTYNKMYTLKLIKYFITERISGSRMLDRAISRFNTLNKLKRRDLM